MIYLLQTLTAIGLATFDGFTITPTGPTSVTLQNHKSQKIQYTYAQTLTIEGQKVGYLMYNAFTRDFDPELNAVFGDL